jgi:hypothetical protein
MSDATPGPAENVAETVPTPATFNETNTITSTQQMLADVLQVDSAQQGSPVLNAPNSFSGVLPPNATNSYRWE